MAKSGGGAAVLREWLNWIVGWMGFSADRNEAAEMFPLASQIMLGIVAAALAWVLIHSGQRRSAEEARRLERAKFLHDLDEEYAHLLARRCIAKIAPAEYRNKDVFICDESELSVFEYVLTKNVVWFDAPKTEGGSPGGDRLYLYVNGHRYIEVSEGVFMETLTMHRIIAWAKRVAAGLQARIIDPTDVLNMWRHILPLARSNRFAFMASMFGVSEARAAQADQTDRLALFYQRPWLRWAYRNTKRVRAVQAAFADALDLLSPVKRGTPPHWSGDIAPLYLLIRTVVRHAIGQGRLEVLNYVGVDLGPGALPRSSDGADPRKLDPILANQMFR